METVYLFHKKQRIKLEVNLIKITRYFIIVEIRSMKFRLLKKKFIICNKNTYDEREALLNKILNDLKEGTRPQSEALQILITKELSVLEEMTAEQFEIIKKIDKESHEEILKNLITQYSLERINELLTS